jgi:hypothetical protein
MSFLRVALFWSLSVACMSTDLLKVITSPDGAYVVNVGGKPWLQSGGLRVFLNGEWHGTHVAASPPPNPAKCAVGMPNTTIVGTKTLRSFPNGTDANCCAACGAEKECTAWVRTTKADGTVPANTCSLVTGTYAKYRPSNDRTAQLLGGLPLPAVLGKIAMKAPPAPPVTGSDRFGSYSKTSFEWHATSSKGEIASFETSIRAYTDGCTVVFAQGIASGAKRTNHRNVTFADAQGVHGQAATVEPFPFMHFPSFNTSHPESIFATAGQAGFSTWKGTMVGAHGPFQGAPHTTDLGLSSGPVLVFDGRMNGGGNHALMVSPATHFKGATMNSPPPTHHSLSFHHSFSFHHSLSSHHFHSPLTTPTLSPLPPSHHPLPFTTPSLSPPLSSKARR